jgi:4-amino-4-deoxychorismate lyase
MRVLAMLDGSVGDPDQPLIKVEDLGLMRGDGVFETILVVDGRPRELDPHLDRLARSAAMLDMPAPDAEGWRRAVRTVLDNWTGDADFALKLVYTRGVEGADEPTAFALGMEIGEKVRRQREQGIAAITLERGIEPGLAERAPWLLLGAKSLSYAVNMAAGREAARRGADEVIFTATDGTLLEGPTSTVVLAGGRTLRTPPSQLGILPGTTQYALFRAAERAGWSVKVEPIPAADLTSADAVVMASSVRKITRVNTVNGAALKDSTAVHRDLVGLYESEYQG